ncbi:hypothetical protein L1987_09766 [Smallanthus sonchifolius]|uniref:Uncharacterized protein n=1 Tax=Smallanthus sonchifolius TaxID=185202 RepID=A0ACB9JQF0_9ASTR|nr:hypothetical protein L1987_09766 [Smallanthus sonchifolius]
MEAHAKAICSRGGHILNVGFGMGVVGTAIQQYGCMLLESVVGGSGHGLAMTGAGQRAVVGGRRRSVAEVVADGGDRGRWSMAVVGVWAMVGGGGVRMVAEGGCGIGVGGGGDY